MPRRKLLRRFDPQYGVNEGMVAVEAKYLAREIENRETVAPSRIEAWLKTSHNSSHHAWDELQSLVNQLTEQERWIIHSLLFRDFFHILALYLHHLRVKYPIFSTLSPPMPIRGTKPQSAFS